eukprot:1947005-Pyramimonas_sp.AAC.2
MREQHDTKNTVEASPLITRVAAQAVTRPETQGAHGIPSQSNGAPVPEAVRLSREFVSPPHLRRPAPVLDFC